MYLERGGGGIRRRLEWRTRRRWGVQELSGDVRTVGSWIGQALRWTEVWYVDFPVSQGVNGEERDVGKAHVSRAECGYGDVCRRGMRNRPTSLSRATW